MTAATTTLSAKEVAEKFGTDPRSFRRFLRSRKQGVGTGNRYSLTPDTLPSLKRDFVAWAKAEQERRATRAATSKEKTDA